MCQEQKKWTCTLVITNAANVIVQRLFILYNVILLIKEKLTMSGMFFFNRELQEQAPRSDQWSSSLQHIHWACVLLCQIKSSAAQETLSDCLTVHQLQTTLSPLSGTDSSLNSPPNALKESCRGRSLHRTLSVIDGLFCKHHLKRFFGRSSAAVSQGCDSSADPRFALLRSIADGYRCVCVMLNL